MDLGVDKNLNWLLCSGGENLRILIGGGLRLGKRINQFLHSLLWRLLQSLTIQRTQVFSTK
ncbi:hypothetical protein OsccyDRAFT_3458 [Leptolyngbyaceae cyanobacterium JSC-12]|nr:hypothetical protein OsccyDRAFT_3458 [Leptolyngbyaceae cyanobacterium JSC-12]